MTVAQLEFEDFNLDGSMGKEYARIIKCTVNGISIFDIHYEPDRGGYYWIKEGFFPFPVFKGFSERDERFEKLIREEIKDKEEAKKSAQKAYEMYIQLFEQQLVFPEIDQKVKRDYKESWDYWVSEIKEEKVLIRTTFDKDDPKYDDFWVHVSELVFDPK